MEWATANFHFLLKMNPAASSYRLQGFQILAWFSVSWSTVECLYYIIYRGKREPKSHVCEMQPGDSVMEWMSGDVGFNKSPGYYMKLTLKTKSYCVFSIIIPNLVTVKTQILVCSCWSNVLSLTQKTQIASISSISCNIQWLAYHKVNSIYHGQHSGKNLSPVPAGKYG